jgi:hypothetical protein
MAYAIQGWRINSFYREALSPSVPYSPAIDRLATFRGERARVALFAIAKSQKASADNQDAAIRALAHRGDPDTALQLSQMLKLSDNLTMREAIAETLQELACDRRCTQFILIYLERRWYGERGSEENLGGVNQFVSENNAIEHNLRLVLGKSSYTGQVLADQYGIDMRSAAPSPFALNLAGTLNLRSICPQLQSSLQELTDLRSNNKSLLQLLVDTDAKLGCK